MKKMMVPLAMAIAMITGTAQAATSVTAQSVATWSATAKKDTTSKLVVTPLGSLLFNYAQGVKGFNTINGLFDVAIEGDTTATDFKLTSKVISDTLTQLNNSGSTLKVGVSYNGKDIDNYVSTPIIDGSAKTLGGNLSAIYNGYKKSGRTQAQDHFTFRIVSATTDGKTPAKDFSELPDGIWSGDVSVEFNATWTS